MNPRLFGTDPEGTGGAEEGTPSARVSDLEAELDSLQNLHRCILDHVQCALVQMDEKGDITDCNARFEEAAGATLEDLRRMRWEDLVASEDLDRLRGFFRDRTRSAGSVPSSYTFRFISTDGVSRFMQASVGMIPGSGGRIISLTDLSEIVRAQNRTAESEDRYRTAVENTLDGILICREETVLFANTTFCRLTDWPREDVYTLNPLLLFHPADRNRLIPLLSDPPGAGDGGTAPSEALILRRDGTSFPAEVSPVKIGFRGSQAVLLTIRDLTQRKQAERLMRENHQLFKAIVDNSPVAVSVHDRNGTLLMANGAWRKIWGKTEADLEKLMQPRERLRMDRRDNYLAGYLTQVEKVYREGGELLIPQLRIFNPPPGGAEWISHHFYAIQDESGGVDKVVVLTSDLTEFFRTREQLEQSEGQYRELVENTPVAIYRTSIEDGGKLLSVNPEMLRLFRIPSQADLSAIKVDAFYVDEKRRHEFLEVISRGDAVENFEAVLRRTDGTTFPASISARGRYDREGNLSCIEGIIRDSTSPRRPDPDPRRIERPEILGTLAREIARDLGELLLILRGDIGLALADPGEPGVVAQMEHAAGAVEEATDLTRELFAAFGTDGPQLQPIDLDRVLRDTAAATLRGSGITVTFDPAPGLGPVPAEVDSFSRVLRSLFLHAARVLPEGGTLSCSTRKLRGVPGRSDTGGHGESVLLLLRTSGPGLPPGDGTGDEPSEVRNPAVSGGWSQTLCDAILRRQGGSLEISPLPGDGIEIRVVLLLPVACPERISAGDRPAGAVAGARILIMDDTPLVREVLSGMLGRLGCRVEESASGEEAVRLYSEALSTSDPFAAVILDLTIQEGEGGVRTMGRLMELDPGVVAIVSSGYSNASVLAEYRNYGFAGRLVKPYTIEGLAGCLGEVLSSARCSS